MSSNSSSSNITFKKVWEILIVVSGIIYLLYIFFKENYERRRYDLRPRPTTPNPNVPRVVIAGDASRPKTIEDEMRKNREMKEAALSKIF